VRGYSTAMGDWFLHPRRRHLADALVLAWVLVWAVAGYRRLRALGAPWADGDHRALADAELAREGVTRP
jgi:hypothetical protein